MDRYLAFLTVIYLIASIPLLFGTVCGFRYRSRRGVSNKVLGMLLATSVLSLIAISCWPAIFSTKTSNVLLLLGAILNSVLFLAFSIRKLSTLNWSLRWVMAGLTVVELAILAAVDHRFRIVVRNSDGMPVDVSDSDMVLGHAGSSFGASFIEIRKSTRVGKGEYYFGLLLWLKRKSDYTFCGEFHDSNGNLIGDLEFQRAEWSEWPKYVVVNQNAER